MIPPYFEQHILICINTFTLSPPGHWDGDQVLDSDGCGVRSLRAITRAAQGFAPIAMAWPFLGLPQQEAGPGRGPGVSGIGR